VQTLEVPWDGGTTYFDVDESTVNVWKLRMALVEALWEGTGNSVLNRKIAVVATQFGLRSKPVQSATHDWHFLLERLPRGPHEGR
jgi:hypothetical protein